jgi:hypothetical protein
MTRALYGLRIRQPIGGDFGVSGDLVRHYLEQTDWDADVSKFGVDIWMTTKAITGGFAVCQTRLGAKVHDPKDPGADLGPMFSQVVATLLRLTDRHAERWLSVRGSHDIPIYGFERLLDPPPLNVNTRRLLDEFANGRRTNGDTWQLALAPQNFDAVDALVADALIASETGPFTFPDELWARVIYDCAVAHHDRVVPLDKLIAALIPMYFGRVASLVIETADLTTDQAEAFVERQARVFELAKPYLVERWAARAEAAGPAAPAAAGSSRNGPAVRPRSAPRVGRASPASRAPRG